MRTSASRAVRERPTAGQVLDARDTRTGRARRPGGDPRALTIEAGRLALDWFEQRSSLAVALKGPQDYASEADAAVERMLRSRFAEAFPDDAFLGEEEGGEVGEPIWVADPIDGTANFVRGVPRFCVSLAFVADGGSSSVPSPARRPMNSFLRAADAAPP